MFTGETPLCLAASGGHIFDAIESGDIRMVKELFTADPNIINTENAGGETPLFYGVRHGKKEIVEFFLSKGADIDVKKNNLTVLQLAAKLS
jgi:ankyrin repeat protein